VRVHVTSSSHKAENNESLALLPVFRFLFTPEPAARREQYKHNIHTPNYDFTPKSSWIEDGDDMLDVDVNSSMRGWGRSREAELLHV